MTDAVPLQLDAELTVRHGRSTFDIWSEGRHIVVNASSLSALRDLRALKGALKTSAQRLDWPVDALPEVDLRVRHATVARLGQQTRPTPGTRTLFGADAAIRLRGVLAAATRALG